MQWDGETLGQQVGSDDARFLPMAAQVCHSLLELPAPLGAVPLCPTFGGTAGLAGALDPCHCRHLKAYRVPWSRAEAAAALHPPAVGFPCADATSKPSRRAHWEQRDVSESVLVSPTR